MNSVVNFALLYRDFLNSWADEKGGVFEILSSKIKTLLPKHKTRMKCNFVR